MVRHLAKRIRRVEQSAEASFNIDQIDLSMLTDQELDWMITINEIPIEQLPDEQRKQRSELLVKIQR